MACRHVIARSIAVGLLIVKEAGGFVQAMDPEDDILESGTVIAGNEPIYDQFAKVIRGA